MASTSETNPQSLLAKLKNRLAQATDSEPEQAIKIRLTIGMAVLLYFCIPWAGDATFIDTIKTLPSLITLGYYFGALLIAAAIIISPKPSPLRRVMGIMLDLTSLSVLMFFAGSKSVIMLVLYLWIILGMGFRYGVNYLYFSLFIGLVGFVSVISWADYWQGPHQQPIAISLLFLLTLIPLYCAFLINKLHAAIATAKHANEAKSRFLANMSHELRTPLNGVIGIADLMRETNLNTQQYEFVNIMRSSANILLGLIENVLDISKIEAGKITIANDAFDLHQLINTIMQIQSPMGTSKGISVSYNINAATHFLLKGDEQHLKQILINLIGNAIKFTPEGSVKLYVTVANSHEDELRLRFEIQDTGIGIPEDALPSIFDDFTQAISGPDRPVGGTGLGTTISKELVELMGGEIGVESKLGESTTFWFELPFTSVPYDNLTLPDNHLLLLSTEETESTLSPILKTWDISYDWVSSSARALSELMKAFENDRGYQTLILDQASMLNIEPIQFAKMIRAEHCLAHLSLILVNTSEQSQQDPRIREHFLSTIPDLTDRRLLFNAIHATQTVSFDDTRVVSLADHYAAKTYAPSLTILIAEDNRVNQQVIEGVLQHAGHNTLIVDTGDKALDILADQIDDIDMLILDMNMPGMVGVEVIQAIQYMDTSRAIPIIMLTADATPEAKAKCLDAGADAFLTKPINSRSLLDHIARLAGTHIEQPAIERSSTSIEDNKSPWIDNAVISELSLLGRDGGLIKKIIQGFEFDGEKHIAIIKDSAADDYLAYRESLHALKGSATEMGALKLVDLCAEAETLKPYDIGTQKVITLCSDIENAFLKTVSALHTTIATSNLKQKSSP